MQEKNITDWKGERKERRMGNGLGDNEEKERPRSGTIVEYGRRMSGNFLREIWGEEGEESKGKGKGRGKEEGGRWISGGFLRSTTRGVEREGEQPLVALRQPP